MAVTNLIDNKFPDWSEIDYFDIVNLHEQQIYNHERRSVKECIFIGEGSCQINICSGHSRLDYGDNYNVTDKLVTIISLSGKATLIVIGGNWKNEIGGSGVFKISESDNPINIGDPTDYERNTNFDNHYHDCDEYWIIFDGKALVSTEGNEYEVKKGDCVYTKMGDNHDIFHIHSTIKGVYFETTLKGKKRLGHLWKNKHN